ncbi:MAG TPA: hypothetical protein VMS73_07860 [Anaerolineaceae bacterium]|nr:hypothetical protein [Anaerolineaceae bacterium]
MTYSWADQASYQIHVQATNPWGDSFDKAVHVVKGYSYSLPIVYK